MKLKNEVKKYNFSKNKYGEELLIDLVRLDDIKEYITEDRPHSLSYYDITLITGGKGYISIDHYRYRLEPGLIIFSSPGQIRVWDIKNKPAGYALIFEDDFLSCFLNDSRLISGLGYFDVYSTEPKLALKPKDKLSLENLMHDIENEIKSFRSNDQRMLRALLYQVLVWLNRKYAAVHHGAIERKFNKHVESFTDLVKRDCARHHSVRYYSDALFITPGHLNNLCSLHLGISAKQYIQQQLILNAKRLLLYSDLSVSEIARSLHFQDTSYFVRRFKLSAGTTPLYFRKNRNP